MNIHYIKSFLKKHLLLFIFFLFIFIFFLHPVGGDGDIYHHLYTGRDILQYHAIPSVDKYTFTENGSHWIANAWGMGVIFYLIYIIFGGTGLSIFVSLIAVLLFVLSYKLVRAYGVGMTSALLTLTIGASIVGIRWLNRPEIIMYPIFVGLLLINFYQEKHPKIVLFYPPIFFLWANLYGASVVIGYGLLGLFVVQKILSSRKKLQISKVYIISLISSFLLAFVNGNGTDTLFYSYIIRGIGQWQGEWLGIFSILNESSLNYLLIDQYNIAVYFLYLALCIILACLFFNTAKKYPLLLVLWLALLWPFLQIRQTTIATILSLPLLALLIQASIKRWRKYAYSILLTLAAISVGIIWWTSIHGIGMDKTEYSEDIISLFNKYNLSGNVYTDQQFGSFLSFYLYPKVRVFIDTRDDLFVATPSLKDYENVLEGKDILPIINKYHPSILVIDPGSSPSYRSLFYAPNWDLVYYNGNRAIFVPGSIAKNKHMKTFPAIDPYAQYATKPNMQLKAAKEYSELLQNNNSRYSLQLQLQLARSTIAGEKYDKSLSIVKQIDTNQGPLTPLFDAEKNRLLVLLSFTLNNCIDAKTNIAKYNESVSGKFLFNWSKRIPSEASFDNVYYYIACEDNQAALIKNYQAFIYDKYNSSPIDIPKLNSLIYQKYGNISLPDSI